MQVNDPRLAEESFRRAVVLNPGDGNTLHNLGWLHCQQRRFDEADRAFEQALASPLLPEILRTASTIAREQPDINDFITSRA